MTLLIAWVAMDAAGYKGFWPYFGALVLWFLHVLWYRAKIARSHD